MPFIYFPDSFIFTNEVKVVELTCKYFPLKRKVPLGVFILIYKSVNPAEIFSMGLPVHYRKTSLLPISIYVQTIF